MGISEELEKMKAHADEIITNAEKGFYPEQNFIEAVLQIHKVMRPNFGPANGALFNARERKIEELAKKFDLDREKINAMSKQ